jgi:hypothetical protein
VDILGLVALGVGAFVATNIDNIFVLMMFFSSLTYPVIGIRSVYRNWFADSHQRYRFPNLTNCSDLCYWIDGGITDSNRY